MTQDKELLLKDLSGRLPYGVKVSLNDGENVWLETLSSIGITDGRVYINGWCVDSLEDVKPYLFPLSSLTEEQKRESPFESSLLNAFINGYISLFEDEELTAGDIVGILDWLNKNHIDYRGLTKDGAAVDATDLNIYKK